MSISIIHEPPQFQPVLTDGIFYTFSANTTGVYKFRYTYDVYVNGTLEFSAKATPNPFGVGLADISRVLKTYCFNKNTLKTALRPNYCLVFSGIIPLIAKGLPCII